ncbi:hypothetical protein CP556_24735 [Natrinema sp. CBA1119]|nr:hypothetical protein CP556_24735 [Natrinema sp. CBA1119]
MNFLPKGAENIATAAFLAFGVFAGVAIIIHLAGGGIGDFGVGLAIVLSLLCVLEIIRRLA